MKSHLKQFQKQEVNFEDIHTLEEELKRLKGLEASLLDYSLGTFTER